MAPPGAPAESTSTGNDHGAGHDEEPVKILLVDDRPENLLALEAILESLGQTLVRANSGHEALRQLLLHEFAVILLDVQMPGMSGFETARLVKARERSRSIPIIFLTAISKEEEYVFKGYEVGAVDYISKPFHPDILRSKVAAFVELFRKQQQLKRQEELLRESERRELELEHRATLFASEARTAAIVDSARDAIISCDEEGLITLFNTAAEVMFRRIAADMLGAHVRALFATPESEDAWSQLSAAAVSTLADDEAPHAANTDETDATRLGARAPRVLALTGVRVDGQQFPVEASVSRLDLDEAQAFTLIARDVTERTRVAEALRQQAESLAETTTELKEANEQLSHRQRELERAMTARNRFYASMSHELRTPINAIIGYNTLLLDNIYGPLNDQQTHGIQRTHKAAKHLLELVNDVLDLSKIEAGKIELSLQPVTFPALIDDLFVTVRPMADEHGSPLSLEHTGESKTIVTDPRRVRQILLNLLSNAIKFGAGKPIHVESRSLDDGGVELVVRDEGRGIAEEDLPRIFDEFVQLTQTQQPGGTGLGLPISKRLADLLSGELTVDSSIGKGSSFTLRLPREADDQRFTLPQAEWPDDPPDEPLDLPRPVATQSPEPATSQSDAEHSSAHRRRGDRDERSRRADAPAAARVSNGKRAAANPVVESADAPPPLAARSDETERRRDRA
jgi:signal transduction histidine kinase